MLKLNSRGRAATFAGAVACAVLAGCSGSGSGDVSADTAFTEKVAACIVADARDDRLYELGQGFSASGGVAWRRGDAIGCEGAFRYAVSESFRAAVGTATSNHLLGRSSYRQGLYAGLGVKVGVPGAERNKLARIGTVVEEGATAAIMVNGCALVPGSKSDYMDAIAYAFALSSVGVQLSGLTDEQVYDLTEQLILSAGNAALHVAREKGCLDPQEPVDRLNRFTNEMGEFRQGKHELAKGCRAEVLLDEVVLKCGEKTVPTDPTSISRR